MTGILIWQIILTSIFIILSSIVAIISLSEKELWGILPVVGFLMLLSLPILGLAYTSVAFGCFITYLVLSCIGLIVVTANLDTNDFALFIIISFIDLLLLANIILSIIGIVLAA